MRGLDWTELTGGIGIREFGVLKGLALKRRIHDCMRVSHHAGTGTLSLGRSLGGGRYIRISTNVGHRFQEEITVFYGKKYTINI